MGALLAAMVLVPTSWTSARPAGGYMENTEGFKAGFGMSFYGLDACGDRKLGEQFRRALMDRFRRCPFSPEARAVFKAWAKRRPPEPTPSLIPWGMAAHRDS